MNLEEMNPAEMLSAVMNDELSLDGEVLESKRQTPEPTDEPTDKPEDATEANNADKAEPEGAPIASKSGGYTIPYEKLAEARDRAKNFEAENEQRLKAFADWQVDGEMMRAAKPDTLFMHCLPAHRGEEVSADVIDGPHSVVWDEAENRLHAQKAVMRWCLGA